MLGRREDTEESVGVGGRRRSGSTVRWRGEGVRSRGERVRSRGQGDYRCGTCVRGVYLFFCACFQEVVSTRLHKKDKEHNSKHVYTSLAWLFHEAGLPNELGLCWLVSFTRVMIRLHKAISTWLELCYYGNFSWETNLVWGRLTGGLI